MPNHQVTNIWVSPDGDEVAVRFDDGTIAVESHGGSRSADDESVEGWRPLFGQSPVARPQTDGGEAYVWSARRPYETVAIKTDGERVSS